MSAALLLPALSEERRRFLLFRFTSQAGQLGTGCTKMDGQCFPCLLLLLVFTVAVGLDTYSETTVTPHNVSDFLEERANGTAFLNDTHRTLVDVYTHMALGCWINFALQMDNVSKEHWCEWKSIVRAYYSLRDCLEGWADELRYSYPNALAVDYTMRSHRTYFLNCSLERPPLLDPPENVLLTLIIAPICLIPFLVTLVVLKSKDGEMQS